MPFPALPTAMAVKAFLARAWPFLLAGVVGLVLLLTYCEGKRSGRSGADLAREKANVETLKNKSAADDTAAGARVEAARRQSREQAELERVTENETDPRERRRAFHRCLRMQQDARRAGRPAPQC